MKGVSDMWQIIAVILAGIGAVLYIIYRLYHLIAIARHKEDPCAGCSGCALKGQMKHTEGCQGM